MKARVKLNPSFLGFLIDNKNKNKKIKLIICLIIKIKQIISMIHFKNLAKRIRIFYNIVKHPIVYITEINFVKTIIFLKLIRTWV